MPSPTPDPALALPPELKVLLPGKTVYCSFSGGADSLALLLVLREWQKAGSFSLEAVHFEHGIRAGASLADAGFCRETCRKENIPFQLFRLDVPARRRHGEGEEEAARRLRLEYWRQIVRDPGNSLIATGHYAGDRIENVFLRLFRGSNVSGLSSMRLVQRLGELTVIRPFINVTRQQLEAYLAARGATSWRHDATNDSTRYRRNFLRLKLLPEIQREFPFACDGILQSLRTLETDAACLELLAQREFERLSPHLPVAELRQLPAALRVRVIRLFLQQALNRPAFVPDSRLLARVEQLLARPREAARIPLRGIPDRQLTLKHGGLSLFDPAPPPAGKKTWDPLHEELCQWNGSLWLRAELLDPGKTLYAHDKSSAYFDAGRMMERLPLFVTVWRAGDRMVPFGRKQPAKVKKLFASARINSAERINYPVVRAADGEILWVVFLRNADACPVTNNTKQVLRLSAVQKYLQHQN